MSHGCPFEAPVHIHRHINIHTFIYKSICICVCICMYIYIGAHIHIKSLGDVGRQDSYAVKPVAWSEVALVADSRSAAWPLEPRDPARRQLPKRSMPTGSL